MGHIVSQPKVDSTASTGTEKLDFELPIGRWAWAA